MQANLPVEGKSQPRVVRFLIPQTKLRKKRHALGWGHNMKRALGKSSLTMGNPNVRHLGIRVYSGKAEYPILRDVRKAKPGTILAMRTYQAAA